MQDNELKFFECNDPNCGFEIQCKDEGEILQYAMEHARYAHGVDLFESMDRILGRSN